MPHKVTFEHAPGEPVVFLLNNKVKDGVISLTSSFASMDDSTARIYYTVTYLNDKGTEREVKRPSSEVFKTKKKLLASL